MPKEIKERIGFTDLLMPKGTVISKYIKIYDVDGNFIDEIHATLIGYEDEDGNECDENGEV